MAPVGFPLTAAFNDTHPSTCLFSPLLIIFSGPTPVQSSSKLITVPTDYRHGSPEEEDVDHSAEHYRRERNEFDENKVSKRMYDDSTEDLQKRIKKKWEVKCFRSVFRRFKCL